MQLSTRVLCASSTVQEPLSGYVKALKLCVTTEMLAYKSTKRDIVT